MTSACRKCVLLGALLATLGVAGALQYHTTTQLRPELTAERERHAQLAELKNTHQHLQAIVTSPTELDALRSDRVIMNRLRGELEQLKTKAAATAAIPTRNLPETPEASTLRPIATLKNVGRATPARALETAIWAGVGGDLAVLAETLSFDSTNPRDAVAKAKANELWSTLPEAARALYESPEKLVALFAAKEMPLGTMQIVKETADGASNVIAQVRLQNIGGETQTTNLHLTQTPEGWKLFVPPSAIEKYRVQLTAPGGG